MSSFVGLELKHCQLPFANHGHVILADPSPILFYSISSNEIRCLVDIPGPKLPSLANGEMAEYLKTVIAPQVIHFSLHVFEGNSYLDMVYESYTDHVVDDVQTSLKLYA